MKNFEFSMPRTEFENRLMQSQTRPEWLLVSCLRLLLFLFLIQALVFTYPQIHVRRSAISCVHRTPHAALHTFHSDIFPAGVVYEARMHAAHARSRSHKAKAKDRHTLAWRSAQWVVGIPRGTGGTRFPSLGQCSWHPRPSPSIDPCPQPSPSKDLAAQPKDPRKIPRVWYSIVTRKSSHLTMETWGNDLPKVSLSFQSSLRMLLLSSLRIENVGATCGQCMPINLHCLRDAACFRNAVRNRTSHRVTLTLQNKAQGKLV